MSILFTTGATVTFHKLVDYVVKPDFLRFLRSEGFSYVALQYGNEVNDQGVHVSKNYISEAFARENTITALDLAIQNETNDKSTTVFANDLFSFEVFAYDNDIQSRISSADVVVSHAGTGSILDTLRLQKPLIVVTNDDLMDSHQAEVASQFEDGGFLVSLSTEELQKGQLEKKISALQSGSLTFKVLPDVRSDALSSVIAQEMEKSR